MAWLGYIQMHGIGDKKERVFVSRLLGRIDDALRGSKVLVSIDRFCSWARDLSSEVLTSTFPS